MLRPEYQSATGTQDSEPFCLLPIPQLEELSDKTGIAVESP
jgi:hypothetical protein